MPKLYTEATVKTEGQPPLTHEFAPTTRLVALTVSYLSQARAPSAKEYRPSVIAAGANRECDLSGILA